jgi:hypothetical protein
LYLIEPLKTQSLSGAEQRPLTSTWKLDGASGAATPAAARQSAGAPAASRTKRAPTPRGQPSGPTTESVPDAASSTTVRATSAADGRTRAADTGAAAAADAATTTTRTPCLAVAEETERRDAGFFVKRVAGEGNRDERREGEDDDMAKNLELQIWWGILRGQIVSR